jgi:hypothetical protein
MEHAATPPSVSRKAVGHSHLPVYLTPLPPPRRRPLLALNLNPLGVRESMHHMYKMYMYSLILHITPHVNDPLFVVSSRMNKRWVRKFKLSAAKPRGGVEATSVHQKLWTFRAHPDGNGSSGDSDSMVATCEGGGGRIAGKGNKVRKGSPVYFHELHVFLLLLKDYLGGGRIEGGTRVVGSAFASRQWRSNAKMTGSHSFMEGVEARASCKPMT